VAASLKQEDIQQDLRENYRARDREANSQIFHQDLTKECQDVMEGLAHFETKEETTNSRLGALTILGTFAPTDQKIRMMVIHLDRLAPYEGTAWDELP
jgi:hypothetical protein